MQVRYTNRFPIQLNLSSKSIIPINEFFSISFLSILSSSVRYLITYCHRDILESSIDAGFSPLYRACQRGFVRIVKLLVEMEADIESKKGLVLHQ